MLVYICAILHRNSELSTYRGAYIFHRMRLFVTCCYGSNQNLF